MTSIGILYAYSPDDLVTSTKYQYKSIMVPIEFTDDNKPVLRNYHDIGIGDIPTLVGNTNIILEVNDTDPTRLEKLACDAFMFKIASDNKQILDQIHSEFYQISLGLIERQGCAYITEENHYLEFLILNMKITNNDRVKQCRKNYPRVSLFIDEVCTIRDANMVLFWKLDGGVTRKPELLGELDPYKLDNYV